MDWWVGVLGLGLQCQTFQRWSADGLFHGFLRDINTTKDLVGNSFSMFLSYKVGDSFGTCTVFGLVNVTSWRDWRGCES